MLWKVVEPKEQNSLLLFGAHELLIGDFFGEEWGE